MGQGQERRDTSIGSQSGIPASSSDCSGACVAQKAKRGKLGVATGEGSARPPPEPARGGRYSHPGERPGPGRRTPEEYGSDACPIPPQGGDRAEPSPNRAPTPTLQSDTVSGGMGRLFGAAWGSSGEAAERADCDPGAFQYKRGGVDAGRQRVDSGHLPDGCGREARGRGRGPGDGGRRHPRLRGHRGGSTPDQGLGGAPEGGAATPGCNPGCAKASCGESAEAPARDVSHTATEVRGGTRRCQGAGEHRGTTWGCYYAVQAWAFVQGWSQAARQVPSIGSCAFGLGAAYEPEALAHVWARTANTVRCPGVVAEADFVGPIAGCILGFNLQYEVACDQCLPAEVRATLTFWEDARGLCHVSAPLEMDRFHARGRLYFPRPCDPADNSLDCGGGHDAVSSAFHVPACHMAPGESVERDAGGGQLMTASVGLRSYSLRPGPVSSVVHLVDHVQTGTRKRVRFAHAVCVREFCSGDCLSLPSGPVLLHDPRPSILRSVPPDFCAPQTLSQHVREFPSTAPSRSVPSSVTVSPPNLAEVAAVEGGRLLAPPLQPFVSPGPGPFHGPWLPALRPGDAGFLCDTGPVAACAGVSQHCAVLSKQAAPPFPEVQQSKPFVALSQHVRAVPSTAFDHPAATFGKPSSCCQSEHGTVECRTSPTQREKSRAGSPATAALAALTLAAPLSTTAGQTQLLPDGVPPVECTHAASFTGPVNASPTSFAAGVPPVESTLTLPTVALPAPRRPTDLQHIRSTAIPIYPDTLVPQVLQMLPDQLAAYTAAPDYDDQGNARYSIFDWRLHSRSRRFQRGWSLGDILADAVHSAPFSVRSVQVLQRPIAGFPSPQVVLTDRQRIGQAIPVDMRQGGGALRTLQAAEPLTCEEIRALFQRPGQAEAPGPCLMHNSAGELVDVLRQPTEQHEWVAIIAGPPGARAHADTTSTTTEMLNGPPRLLGNEQPATPASCIVPYVLSEAQVWPPVVLTQPGMTIPVEQLHLLPSFSRVGNDGITVPYSLLVHGFPPVQLFGSRHWTMADFCRDAVVQLDRRPSHVQFLTVPLPGLDSPQVIVAEPGQAELGGPSAP